MFEDGEIDSSSNLRTRRNTQNQTSNDNNTIQFGVRLLIARRLLQVIGIRIRTSSQINDDRDGVTIVYSQVDDNRHNRCAGVDSEHSPRHDQPTAALCKEPPELVLRQAWPDLSIKSRESIYYEFVGRSFICWYGLW